MRASFIKVRNILFTLILIGGVFSSGYYFGVKGYTAKVDEALNVKIDRTVPPNKNADFSLFWQVWDTLSAKYYDKSKLVPADMVNGAISGMVSALGDPYTMYLPPRENKIVDDDLKGKFEGVGIELGFRDKILSVISPLSNSPAERAGIKPMDYIIHIKDEKKNIDKDTNGMSIQDAVNIIRGPANTQVILTLVREGKDKPFEVSLTREELKIDSIKLIWVGEGQNVAHVKVSKFGAETVNDWDKIVREITAKNDANGIIIDVRNNPGGYMQAAIDMAGDFVATGTVVVIQENGDKSQLEFKSQKLPRLENVKVVILINAGSASASEILSGALRDKHDTKLIGDKSFGKGTIQEPLDLTGGAGLHITVAKWLTPNKTWVHGAGLMPDIEIKNPEDNSEDLQLKKAIEQF